MRHGLDNFFSGGSKGRSLRGLLKSSENAPGFQAIGSIAVQPPFETIVARKEAFRLAEGDALLVVDVQNDFLPGGALAVPGGDQIIAKLNGGIELFVSRGCPVVFSRDWHPADHISFRAQGGPWPSHCVAGTPGAQFAPWLLVPQGALIVSKGVDAAREAYSAFDQTNLAADLRAHGTSRLFIAGLATEYCVAASAGDALDLGFRVIVLSDAIAELDAEAARNAIDRLTKRGALVAMTNQLT